MGELEQIVQAAGCQWVIRIMMGRKEIHKSHVDAVYCAFKKPLPGPAGDWRNWVEDMKVVVGWDALQNKFTKL